ncbi:MAG: Beta propeller domain protein [Pelotomaculum sp. PtaB.Bin013]|uniref:Beta-propeller domain-containing protein n=1 Tax=Pelotomaculum isophthalicicum JI TaxID=947010 RepID=A0A9X4H338_9FIRM|nr:beta-propeller domain-containing protein [Pelotomaculum isophthalicicum]MDF9408836.1 beta-propeller domain-containing protein [Pelotomaculum isophthalicicum JI]OPX89777.1 MAG: Beta propeller domain protein [Pelotomaculum sp. PtaB.Bin013]
MKKFVFLIVALALAVIFIPWLQPKGSAMDQHQATFLVNQKTYINDGQTIATDVSPFVRDGRVYVPVRYLGRALGISNDNITWDGMSQTVTFDTDAAAIRLTVGSNLLYVGEQERSMDVAPLVVSDRVFIPARWLAEALKYEVEWDEATQAVLIGPPGNLPGPPPEAADLPVVGTYDNLKSLLANLQTQASNDRRVMVGAPAGTGAMKQESAKSAVTNNQSVAANDADYSKTNVQVEGVDEADIVKTDGSYIYLVKGQRVIIALAYPAGDMKIISTLDFTDKNFAPNEMYVDDKYLIVIGQTYRYRENPPGIMPMNETSKKISSLIYPPPYQRDTVKAIIYDIGDKSAVKQVRELELDGRYVSSRKIGEAFYLLANRSIYYYSQKEIEDPKPFYRDTAAGDAYVDIDYSCIKCFPGFMEPNYLIVAGINLDRPDEKADVNTYLGSGENIYASMKNLYVAVTSYQYRILEDSKTGLLPEPGYVDSNKTKVYKFALNDGKLSYTAGGEVPGTILNQFSMDEYNDYFRIATTSGDIWRTGEYTSKNNVYVLDSGLNVSGKLEDIAPGERIYSVRFVGDRGYMVTFKTVDPFFVIDLKEPGRPQILGALKIPGYSDYLHPYDENHIIGFGKDTIELGQKGGNNGGTNSMAYYTGMKMAIFDVTDVSNPVEMYKEKIGDRGTDSELLRNHKALLFSKDKNLLAFPVSLMEVKGSEVQDSGFPAYGQFVYQGAYVYNIDLASGFTLKGRISHLSDEDYKKAGNYWYDSDKNVDRIIYINDVLYTLSGKYIKANSLNDLAEIGTLEIK